MMDWLGGPWGELVRAIIAAILGWLAGWKFPPTRKE